MENKRMRAMFWIDTREMLADGLTKGGVDRQLLDWACDAGYYLLKIGNHVRCTRTRIGASTKKESLELDQPCAERPCLSC